MERSERSAEVQLLKTPSGDAMLMVHIDKENLQQMIERGAVVAVFPELATNIKLPQCLARYDRFMVREDFVIEPGLERIR